MFCKSRFNTRNKLGLKNHDNTAPSAEAQLPAEAQAVMAEIVKDALGQVCKTFSHFRKCKYCFSDNTDRCAQAWFHLGRAHWPCCERYDADTSEPLYTSKLEPAWTYARCHDKCLTVQQLPGRRKMSSQSHDTLGCLDSSLRCIACHLICISC